MNLLMKNGILPDLLTIEKDNPPEFPDLFFLSQEFRYPPREILPFPIPQPSHTTISSAPILLLPLLSYIQNIEIQFPHNPSYQDSPEILFVSYLRTQSKELRPKPAPPKNPPPSNRIFESTLPDNVPVIH